MSKELEALQDLSKLVFIYGGVEQYRIIEKALKALEIVKKCDKDFIKRENNMTKNFLGCFLTDEEYDLLKEVLND